MNDPNKDDFEFQPGMNVRLRHTKHVCNLYLEDERIYERGTGCQILSIDGDFAKMEVIDNGDRIKSRLYDIEYHAEDNDWHSQI